MKKWRYIFYWALYIFLLQEHLFCIKTEVLNYKIFSIDNFDIYYSRAELEPIFSLTEDLLETSFVKETEFFDTKFDFRIPFFLFYGKSDFFQNTILDVTDGTGGVTEAFKNRFLIPYEGSKKKFQHVINHEFVHEIQFNILYSGFWRTPKLLKSIFYPHWLMEGLAEYRAKDFVLTEQEMMVRDMSVSNSLIPIEHLHNFSHLKPYMILPAYEQSAKLMEYIVEEYGEKRIVDLLYVFKEKFDPNTVLNIVCGTNLKSLNKKFCEEMTMMYNYEVKINSMTDFDIKDRVTKPRVFPTHYNSPVVYDNNLIYLGDPDGTETFFIMSLLTNKEKVLLGREKLKNEVDYIDNERISVSKNGYLCFTGLKNNKSKLFIYDINKKKLKNFHIKEIDFINSAYIFPEGDLNNQIEFREFYHGMAKIYKAKPTPIIPIGIVSPRSHVKRKSATIQVGEQQYETLTVLSGKYYANIGKPMHFSPDIPLEEITEQVRKQLEYLVWDIKVNKFWS
jgi:hypothetical protein